MMTSFIGVDLAWQCEGDHSGLAAFHGDLGGAQPVSFGTGATDRDAVTDFILANRTESSVVAIDAPLIIENVSEGTNGDILLNPGVSLGGYARCPTHRD